jgi:hypothetical protein
MKYFSEHFISGALLKNTLQYTEKEVENGIQNWLRRSKERTTRLGSNKEG